MKTCIKCQLPKNEDDFYMANGYREGTCKACKIVASVAWRHAHLGHWNAQRHKRNIMRKFSLTSDEYDYLYNDPTCAGCGAKSGQDGRKASPRP